MDTPRSSQPQKRKRDPEKNKVNQKHYRRRVMASVDGIERERAKKPSSLPRTHHPHEGIWRVRGLQSQKSGRGDATLLQLVLRQARRDPTQKSDTEQGVDQAQEGGGHVPGLQTTVECAAAAESGGEKTGHGGRSVESSPETKVPSMRSHPAPSTVGLVRP